MRTALWASIILGCVVLLPVALYAVPDIPTAVVCARGRTEIEATPHIQGGRFEVYHLGGCTFFNPESRPAPGIRGGNAVGD